jgi:hypothetical protein
VTLFAEEKSRAETLRVGLYKRLAVTSGFLWGAEFKEILRL